VLHVLPSLGRVRVSHDVASIVTMASPRVPSCSCARLWWRCRWTERFDLNDTTAFPPVHTCNNYCSELYNACAKAQFSVCPTPGCVLLVHVARVRSEFCASLRRVVPPSLQRR
jgi:hypothetical protein